MNRNLYFPGALITKRRLKYIFIGSVVTFLIKKMFPSTHKTFNKQTVRFGNKCECNFFRTLLLSYRAYNDVINSMPMFGKFYLIKMYGSY